MRYTLEGREVEVLNYLYAYGEGCYITEAIFTDDGSELSDGDMELLSSLYAAELDQEAFEHIAAKAYDDAKDQEYDNG